MEQELTEAYVTISELHSENKSLKRKTYYCEKKIETSKQKIMDLTIAAEPTNRSEENKIK